MLRLLNVFIIFCSFADATLILNQPKAELTLFTSKKSVRLTHINSYQLQRNKPVKMILHGYRGSSLSPGYQNITEKYVLSDCNVIAVDYPLTETFLETYNSLPVLAEYLAAFIKWINLANLIPVENIHLIGYSLGGQIAGMTGHLVSKGLKKKLSRITALEPTRVGFESIFIDNANKLDPSDAEFVDVVHTDSSVSLIEPAGHVDYYPNAGEVLQPGCEYLKPSEVLPEMPPIDGWERPYTIDNLCSHILARSYFTEAILSDKFLATKCDSWQDYTAHRCDGNQKIVFGEHTDRTARGKFVFKTMAEWPYYITE